MAWVSPTGHNEPNNKYSGETNAYDENTGTNASTSENGYYLELTHAAILCDKVRIYAAVYYQTATPPYAFFVDPDIDIDVYYSGGWHNIWSGVITERTWVEKAIGSNETVTKARIKFSNIQTGHINDFGQIYEFDFNDITPTGIERPKVGGSLAAGKRGLA